MQNLAIYSTSFEGSSFNISHNILSPEICAVTSDVANLPLILLDKISITLFENQIYSYVVTIEVPFSEAVIRRCSLK